MDLKLIEDIVRMAHEGQLDKSGKPYIDHVLRVRDSTLGELYPLVSYLRNPFLATALCHDVLEDTKLPYWLVSKMVDAEVMAAVLLLTRDPKVSYEEYIYSLLNSAALPSRPHELAYTVKLADLHDNLDPARMKLLDPETREKLCKRYYAALDVLEGR